MPITHSERRSDAITKKTAPANKKPADGLCPRIRLTAPTTIKTEPILKRSTCGKSMTYNFNFPTLAAT